MYLVEHQTTCKSGSATPTIASKDHTSQVQLYTSCDPTQEAEPYLELKCAHLNPEEKVKKIDIFEHQCAAILLWFPW